MANHARTPLDHYRAQPLDLFAWVFHYARLADRVLNTPMPDSVRGALKHRIAESTNMLAMELGIEHESLLRFLNALYSSTFETADSHTAASEENQQE